MNSRANHSTLGAKGIKRWNSFSVMNATQGSKVYLLKLNIPTACPPRTAVPVNQRGGIGSSPTAPSSHSVRDATVPAMSDDNEPELDWKSEVFVEHWREQLA
jgi:hypothetical protein